MKKLVIVIMIIILIALGAYGVFMALGNNMAKHIEREYDKVETVDLGRLSDGVYPGSFGDFLVAVNLEVTVKDHNITGITIKDQRCGKGYEARDTVTRIVEAQSPRVDVVSGASSSSKCIMIAAHKALQKQ